MSSSDQDALNLDMFNEEDDGHAMDIELLGSSEHEDGEQDPQQVDEASKKEGTPNVTDSANAEEKMESSQEEEALNAAKVADKIVTEVGTENPDLIEIPVEQMTTDDNAVTLSESDEAKDIAEKEAAEALTRGANQGKSVKEVARLSQVALDMMENLDPYLDVFMLDQTMTIAGAVKSGDVVVIIPCPHGDHKVCLAEGVGFFIIDMADLARKTRDVQLQFADNAADMTGCIGFEECTYTLADALEEAEAPDKVFCLEGSPQHLVRTDDSCDIHPRTTSGFRQVVVNLVKLQVEVRKASNKAVRQGENLPILKIMGVMNDRPFLLHEAAHQTGIHEKT